MRLSVILFYGNQKLNTHTSATKKALANIRLPVKVLSPNMHLPLSQPRSNIASCVRGKNWQVTLLRNKIHIQRFTESKSIEVMVEYNRLHYHHHYHHHYYCNHQHQQNHFLRSFIHTSPAH